jgi:tRNA pseudouridine synthase 9
LHFAAHQIRVHLQYLGHPIPNDPIYGEEDVWSACATKAKGGIDLTPEDDVTFTPDYRPDDALEVASNKATIERRLAEKATERQAAAGDKAPARKLMPRETGQDVGSSSPIKLSREAREVIRRLRRMKDEQEDWARCVRRSLPASCTSG